MWWVVVSGKKKNLSLKSSFSNEANFSFSVFTTSKIRSVGGGIHSGYIAALHAVMFISVLNIVDTFNVSVL